MEDLQTVLIVDDEMDMRIFMSTLFETSGYHPEVARDGRQGLEQALLVDDAVGHPSIAGVP